MTLKYASLFLLLALVALTLSDTCKIPNGTIQAVHNRYEGEWYEHGEPPNRSTLCFHNHYKFIDNNIIQSNCTERKSNGTIQVRERFSYWHLSPPTGPVQDPNGNTAIEFAVLDTDYTNYTIEYACFENQQLVVVSTRDKDAIVPEDVIQRALDKYGINSQIIFGPVGSCDGL